MAGGGSRGPAAASPRRMGADSGGWGAHFMMAARLRGAGEAERTLGGGVGSGARGPTGAEREGQGREGQGRARQRRPAPPRPYRGGFAERSAGRAASAQPRTRDAPLYPA